MRDTARPLARTVALAAALGLSLSFHAGAVTISEYPVPSANTTPVAIAPGSDGALWFTTRPKTSYQGSIWRVTTAGAFTEYPLPPPPPAPLTPGFITPGPDGALWFTAVNGGGPEEVAQITTAGVITAKYPDFGDAGLGGITTGPDGALWLANPSSPNHSPRIVRIPADGSAPSNYAIPFEPANGPYPVGITAGPDGALWFTGRFWFSLDHFIGRISTSGAITTYPLPAGSGAEGITAGPDGALWFTEGVPGSQGSGNKIGRITTGGAITEFPIPTANAGAFFITAGPDGALWFTEGNANQIGRITTAGAIAEYPIPTANSAPNGIATGPDGALWFTEMNGNQVGRLVPDPSTIPALISFIQTLTQLNPQDQNSLIVDLNRAANSVGNQTCPQLDTFINDVNAMLQGGRLNASIAAELITGATAVETSRGCFLAPFADVSATDAFLPAIDLLRDYAITSGCSASPPMYCPGDNITRGQMAVFVVRSVMGGDNFTYNSAPYFTDVPATHPFFKWIQEMRDLGITSGCGPTTYCPDDPVTRGQVAAFIIRDRYGAAAQFQVPPTPFFTDVPAGNAYFQWVQKMKQLGITSGCGPSTYCPDDPVTRGQMAVFMVRGAFNQLLPNGTPVLVAVSPTGKPAGQAVTVTITGQNTNFLSGTSIVTAGAAITVSNVTVAERDHHYRALHSGRRRCAPDRGRHRHHRQRGSHLAEQFYGAVANSSIILRLRRKRPQRNRALCRSEYPGVGSSYGRDRLPVARVSS